MCTFYMPNKMDSTSLVFFSGIQLRANGDLIIVAPHASGFVPPPASSD